MLIIAAQNSVVPYTIQMCKRVNLISLAQQPHGLICLCITEKYLIALQLNIALNLEIRFT